jgi:glycosyltransferase involved in cell wall biosynthesis
MKHDTIYSIVVPVFNTSKSLAVLSESLGTVFGDTVRAGYELIFVDDGSSNPETWPALEQIARTNRHARVIQLTRNFGQNAAVLCGLGESKGDYIITMDDDLQHAPEDIPLLLAEKDHDVVFAQFPAKKHHVIRRVLSAIKGLFDRIIIGTPGHVSMTSFRLMKRVVVEGLITIKTPHPYLSALIFHVTDDVVGVRVTHHERSDGRSGYNVIKMIRLFSNLLINNSSFLLRGVGLVGILMSAASFCIAVYLVFKRLTQDRVVEGWTSLMVAILFIGGMVLFSMGVMGEYLVRIISGVESMPTYIVRKRVP